AGENYAAAVRYLEDAVRLLPADQEASEALRQAKKLLAEEREEDARRPAEVAKALSEGWKDLNTKDFSGAKKSFDEPFQKALNDRKVIKAYKAPTDAIAVVKREADELVRTATKSIDEGSYDEAILNLGKAARKLPGDPTYKKLLEET